MPATLRLAASVVIISACGAQPQTGARKVNHCPELPSQAAGVVVELTYHSGDEPRDNFSVQLADGGCPKDAWRGALYPGEDLRCLDVGAEGVADALSALKRARVTEFKVTESRPQDVSPHRGGWIMKVTWPSGTCSVANSWIWEMDRRDNTRFEALRAELGKLRGART